MPAMGRALDNCIAELIGQDSDFAPLNVYLDFLAAVSSLLPNPIKNLAAV